LKAPLGIDTENS